MASIRGKIFRSSMRLFGNVNPNLVKDPVAKLRKAFFKMSINDWNPKGHTLSRETTPAGVKFERVAREGAEKNGRVVCYFHGGAYITGLFSYYRSMAPAFCQAGGDAEMILLDYLCAPEAKYPTQLNQALDLWDDLVGRQGYKPENIIVAGESAGANLTLALMLKLRDAGRELPRAAFCMSTWGDMTCSGPSYIDNYPYDTIFGEKNKQVTAEDRQRLIDSDLFCFVGDADRTDPYVSPVYGDYHGFPPMLFNVGGHEMLLSDTLTIVENLKKNGVSVICDIQPGMFHGYAISGKYTSMLPEGRASFLLILDFISEHLRPEGQPVSCEPALSSK